MREYPAVHLKRNPELCSLNQSIATSIYQFLTKINTPYHYINLEFEITEKVIKNMLKANKIHIDYKDEAFVSNNEIRKLLISSLLDLNMANKEVFILINFSEGEIEKDMI